MLEVGGTKMHIWSQTGAISSLCLSVFGPMYYVFGALLGARAKTLSARGRPIANIPPTVSLTPSGNAEFIGFIFRIRRRNIEDPIARLLVLMLRLSLLITILSIAVVLYVVLQHPEALRG